MYLDPFLFHVSPSTGFVLESPLEYLPDYFKPWQDTAKAMVHLVRDNRCRDHLDRLPLLDIDRLMSHREIRLAHLQLTTLISGYIWCQGDANVPQILPRNLATPFYGLCQKLGVTPGIGAHISTALDFDNDWFFLATIQVELEFAAAVIPLKNALQAAKSDDVQLLQYNLREIRRVIENMDRSLGRMHDHLNPDIFFNQFRPYLAGTTGGKFDQWGGLILEGVSNEPMKLTGGSAAQAAPIQTLDALLGIEHESKSKQFLLDMRNYMLADHRRFIEEIERTSTVRQMVMQYAIEKPQLKHDFDDCVKALINFRNKHIQLVTKYILVPKAKKGEQDGRKSYKTLDDVGTGGTGIMPFLKNVRDTTKQCIAEEDILG